MAMLGGGEDSFSSAPGGNATGGSGGGGRVAELFQGLSEKVDRLLTGYGSSRVSVAAPGTVVPGQDVMITLSLLGPDGSQEDEATISPGTAELTVRKPGRRDSGIAQSEEPFNEGNLVLLSVSVPESAKPGQIVTVKFKGVEAGGFRHRDISCAMLVVERNEAVVGEELIRGLGALENRLEAVVAHQTECLKKQTERMDELEKALDGFTESMAQHTLGAMEDHQETAEAAVAAVEQFNSDLDSRWRQFVADIRKRAEDKEGYALRGSKQTLDELDILTPTQARALLNQALSSLPEEFTKRQNQTIELMTKSHNVLNEKLNTLSRVVDELRDKIPNRKPPKASVSEMQREFREIDRKM